jgi:hypothetical protein
MAWLDLYDLIKSNELKLESGKGETIKPELVIKILNMMTGARLKYEVIRTCTAARWSSRCRPCLCPWPW